MLDIFESFWTTLSKDAWQNALSDHAIASHSGILELFKRSHEVYPKNFSTAKLVLIVSPNAMVKKYSDLSKEAVHWQFYIKNFAHKYFLIASIGNLSEKSQSPQSTNIINNFCDNLRKCAYSSTFFTIAWIFFVIKLAVRYVFEYMKFPKCEYHTTCMQGHFQWGQRQHCIPYFFLCCHICTMWIRSCCMT